MEIYYKVPIYNKLTTAILNAARANEIIDYIVVNDEEWWQLHRWAKDVCPYATYNTTSDTTSEDVIMFYGVKVYRKEESNEYN